MAATGRISVVHLVKPTQEQIREYIISLTSWLPYRTYDVTVVGPLDRALQDALSRASVRWVNVPQARGGVSLWRHSLLLSRLLRARQADIVHVHGYDQAWAALLAVRRLRRRPRLVYTAHELSQWPGRRTLRDRARLWFYRAAIQRMDCVLAFSAAERELLRELSPQAAERCQVVPPGIDTKRVRPLSSAGLKRWEVGLSPEAAVVGIVGELVRGFGMEEFLRAAARVAENLPNVEFAIVGEGPERAEFEQLAHELRITGCTAFLGRRADVAEVIASANLVVVPSEAFGGQQTALMALALDIPVVAFDTPALRELLGDMDDVPLVPPGDWEALAEAMETELGRVPEGASLPTGPGLPIGPGSFMAEKDMLVSMQAYDLDRPGAAPYDRTPLPRSRRARMAQSFSINKMVERVVRIYEQCLAAAPGIAKEGV